MGPDGQSNLKLEGVESGEIESSSFKLPSATQPILSKKRSPIGRKQKSSEFYREGLNPTLDEKLVAYTKKRPFAGDAILNVLTETVIGKMGKLWWKQKSTPFRMTVLEVTTLLEMVTRITAWRKSMTSEKARTRMENFRRRVSEAARKGDPKARKKLKSIKEYHKNMSASYRKSKREKQAKKASKYH